jgi:serine/threonine-protein kinase RsbT
MTSRTGAPPSGQSGPASTRAPSPRSQPGMGVGPATARLGVLGMTERIEAISRSSSRLRCAGASSTAARGDGSPHVDAPSDLRACSSRSSGSAVRRDQQQLIACIRSSPLDHARPRADLVDVRGEEDVNRERSAGHELCNENIVTDVLLTKIVTAISELGRNIVRYAGTGEIAVRSISTPQRAIEIIARDRGPGITNLAEILSGKYRSRHGMGAGLRGTKALMDDFDVKTGPGQGTVVTVRKYIG